MITREGYYPTSAGTHDVLCRLDRDDQLSKNLRSYHLSNEWRTEQCLHDTWVCYLPERLCTLRHGTGFSTKLGFVFSRRGNFLVALSTTATEIMKIRSIPVVLIYVGLLSYAVVTLFPLLWMVVTAMKSGRELFRLPPSLIPDLLLAGKPFVNFAAVFEKAGFLGAVINSMVVATLAALGQLITCSMAGFVFANLRTRMFIGIYVLSLIHI